MASSNAEASGETMVGRLVPTRGGGRPRAIESTRYCAATGCDTRLSKYNRYENCYLHQPKRVPRVRGLKRKSRAQSTSDV